MGVGLRPALGAEFDVAVRHRGGGLLDARVFQEPLHRNARLDRHMGSLGKTDVVFVLLYLDERAHRLQLRRGDFPGGETLQAVQVRAFGAVDVGVGREYVDDGEVVAFADVEVRLVVGRGDFQRAGAEFHVHMVVRDDRNLRMGKRPEHLAAQVFGVSRVFRVHRHRHVAHQRFRAGGGDFKKLAGGVGQLVAHEIQFRALRGHDHLLIGQGGEGHRAPVDDPLAAVDQALFEQLDEDMAHPFRVGGVHREPFAAPIARATEPFELLDDDVAVLGLEIPDALEKLVAAEVAAGFALGFAEFALDFRLGGDAGVVGAGQPQDFLAKLAGAAGQDVLKRVVQDVPEMQDAGDIRRRDDDRIPFFGGRGVGFETFSSDPRGIPFGFHGLGFIGFWQLGHEARSHARARPLCPA